MATVWQSTCIVQELPYELTACHNPPPHLYAADTHTYCPPLDRSTLTQHLLLYLLTFPFLHPPRPTLSIISISPQEFMTSTSTTTTSAHPPPPTFNKLDAAQRARAMRSSRKVGAVLGTTPFLLESCGSTVPVTLHHASKRDPSSDPRTVLSHLKHHHRRCSVFEDARVSSESLPTMLPSHSYSSSKESLLSTSDFSS